VWLHGRGDTITELNFIHQRLTQPGQFTPPDTIVLHPFGRYSNAFQFAGETDVFEAIADLKKRYRIDPDRISIRGFSMGGAGAWRLAAHHPGLWAAAAPGAGFVDTEEYLAGKPSLGSPTPIERLLWTMTNAKEYAANLFALPVVAYSGEIDPQKAAADIMGRELARSGVPLTHLIGPKTGHSYHPETKKELDERFDALLLRGRERVPRRIRFVTYTTRYDRGHWVRAVELEEHWKRAEIDASITETGIQLKTVNVRRAAVDFEPGDCPFAPGTSFKVTVNGKPAGEIRPASDRSCGWLVAGDDKTVWKRHGLQGPIDDAFFRRFVMVRPSPSAPEGIRAEFDHAIAEWRAIFRGDAIVKDEAQLTDADFASANVVLWGTPSTSRWIARFPPPISFPADGNRYLAAIYPHPSSGRYIVLNSGITFREEHSLTNAQQTAKLGDWAILESPYKVIESGVFSDAWRVTAK
jgi:pimeloyl-ACP methyl ester carboxylesterase